ncbi:hypothetical protein [Klebsiella pneumoniae]|uniref:hypothetical protein n=1 Tax=Klebsiella pneumoniae TaxID=573 RepID=UPI001939F4E4|nr:hypothetical protein [Klebsiella pneumoniae]MBM1101751.1 hypothetical protein [Klebsiella pneumoniae]
MVDNNWKALAQPRKSFKLYTPLWGKITLIGDDVLIVKAVCYLNIRHFLMHGDVKLPADFVEELKAEKIDFSCYRLGYIKLNYELIKAFKSSVSALFDHIDNLLMASIFLSPNFIHKGQN